MEWPYFLKESYIFRIYFIVKIMLCPVQKATLSENLKFHIFTLKNVEIFIGIFTYIIISIKKLMRYAKNLVSGTMQNPKMAISSSFEGFGPLQNQNFNPPPSSTLTGY